MFVENSVRRSLKKNRNGTGSGTRSGTGSQSLVPEREPLTAQRERNGNRNGTACYAPMDAHRSKPRLRACNSRPEANIHMTQAHTEGSAAQKCVLCVNMRRSTRGLLPTWLALDMLPHVHVRTRVCVYACMPHSAFSTMLIPNCRVRVFLIKCR